MTLKNILGLSLVAALAAVTATVGGCARQDEETQKKLDQALAKLDSLEKKVEAGGGRGGIGAAGAPGAPGAAARPPGQPQQAPGPDPNTVYSVDVKGSPIHGPAVAKVTIVEAFDFACPFCQRVIPTTDQLVADYKGQVRVVFKDYVVHPQTATLPALAACAAQQQGKYVEMHKLIFEKGFGKNMDNALLEGLAGELSLDMPKFKADMAGDACKADIAADQKTMAAVGVRGTPAFFINGRPLSGARPIEQFKTVIDEELKKADAALASGVKLEDYYQTAVVQKGKKSL